MRRRTAEWVEQAEEDWHSAHALAVLKPPPRNVVCFHCQQKAETESIRRYGLSGCRHFAQNWDFGAIEAG